MGNGASVKKINTKNEVEVGVVKEAFLNRSLSFGEIETPRYSSKKLKEEVENGEARGRGGANGCCVTQLEREVKQLKEQVGWLETVKLDLDDRVDNLTGQVDHLKSNNCSLSAENTQLQITVKKLELELEKSNDALVSSQNQYEELKSEAKVKIKVSQRKLAEFRQSTSLQIFELKQENEELKSAATISPSSRPSTCQKRSLTDINEGGLSADNNRIDAGGQREGCEEVSFVRGGCFSESSSSSNLIVTLSSKIEEQQIEIERLNQQIQKYSTIITITNPGDV